MINIDFHIHTKKTKWDHLDKDEFSFDNLKKLIKTNCLDAIAITNHNSFDFEQYKMIQDRMCKQNILVFPGVEISIDKCHALIIFSELCNESENFLKEVNDYFNNNECIDADNLILKLKKIKNDKFIFIPHVFKSKRNFDLNNIERLIEKGIKIFAIECRNQKQQLLALHNEEYKKFTPVLFSDEKLWETKEDNEEFGYRNTTLLLDKKDVNWNSIYNSLEKKQIRQFNNDKEFDFWKTREGIYSISLGLNIVLGKRGSGKTQTLKRIYNSIIDDDENRNFHPWYVEQFKISEEANEEKFYKELEDNGKKYKINLYTDNIDKSIQTLKDIDLSANEQAIDDDLIKIKTIPMDDIWSQCNVFSDMEFPSYKIDEISEIVHSIQKILNSNLIAHITKKYNKNLKKLLAEVEEEWKKNKLDCILKEKINEFWLKKLKGEINTKTGKEIPDISKHTTQWLKNYLIAEKNRNFFNYISDKQPILTKISSQYTKEISFEKFRDQNSLEKCIAKRINKEIFKLYDKGDIYNFIREISKKIKDIPIETIKQALFNVRVEIKNEFGNCKLSGGERAYVKLLEKFNNANDYDFFIVDEIEQSFDNIFLWNEIIQQKIKPLVEKNITIVISTHNSTIAMLSQPNKIIYCDHNCETDEFKSYFGSLQSKEFKTPDGKSKINSFDTIINILESGEEQYKTKKINYEKLKNVNC